MSDNLEFKVSSGLKSIIGKDLITDDNIAVFELVKNSYDAQAKNIEIIFEEDKIIIADDGKGMSLDDLKDKWLFVAYSAKKDNTEDSTPGEPSKNNSYRDKIQERRHYAGAKGIGRFSSDRLGSFLRIVTRKAGTETYEEVKVDWSKFEEDQTEIFEEIKVVHNSLRKSDLQFPKRSTRGTALEITTLHSTWNRERLKQLKHSLEKLINPFSENNDFSIKIICEKEIEEDNRKENGKFKYIERDRVNGYVNNSILEILKIKTTQISIEANEASITTEIIDRGTPIYSIREKNKEFSLLKNVKIDLYFLNTSAKNNFTRLMGVQPVNFGSVFLFKNGFRVQPFGEIGDDSWGLDYRAQQGYNRFLGTRDLFGKVEILTDDADEFKEVSSRDGGLVETIGYHQIMNLFKEKGLVRLERYVVGVLWGEGFKRRKYFGEGNEADKRADNYRNQLKSDDKISDNTNAIQSNLGSKLDFIQIIKSLVSNKDIEIIDYNRNFVDLVNEKIDEYQTKFIVDLETIAEQTNDEDLRRKIVEIEESFQELKRQKEEAERRADEEERKRKEAEEKAKEEEKKRVEAERKQQEEEERRRKAELAAERKEKERLQAELDKLKAQEKARKEEEARRQAEKIAENQKRQLDRFRSAETVTYKDLRDSNHIIGVYSDDISKKIKLFKTKLDKNPNMKKEEVLSMLQGISLANEKISTITKFTTKSNYLQAQLSTEEDIVKYIKNYIDNIYSVLHKDMKIEFIDNDIEFIRDFQPIELSVVLDNILSNSRKKDASKSIFEFSKKGRNIILSIKDVGKTLDSSMDAKLIFEEGVTSTKGAGLGLSHVKRILEKDFNASIEYNPAYKKGFELIIEFKQ